MTVKVSKPAINVREELADLRKPTGIAGEAMLRAETPQEQFNLIGAGRRNILINGGFTVSQRGDYTTATAHSGNKTYYLDRWAAGNSGCSTTIQDTGRKAKMVCTSGGLGTMRLYQIVELKDINKYLGQKITLSAKVTSNSRDCRLLSYMDGWQVEAANHSGSGEEETLSVTFTVPSTAIVGEASFFVGIDGVQSANVTVSTGDYFEVTEVQLELGKVATPFEHRSYGEELAACQRYFERRGTDIGGWEFISDAGQLTSVNTYQCAVRFNEQMRVPPTMSITGTVSNLKLIRAAALVDVTGVTASDNTNGRTLLLYGTCASSGGAAGEQIRIQTVTPGTWVNFDAEL